MAMTLTGFVYDNAGNAISGATVQGYVSADDQTSGTTAEASTTTNSDGKWSITTSTAARIPMDVLITYGSNKRWIKAGDKVNVTDMTVTGTLTVGEDAAGFDFSLFSSDTSGDGLTWDASEEVLQITGKDANTALDVLDGDVRIVDKLYFYDRGGEYLSSDGSTLTITGAVTIGALSLSSMSSNWTNASRTVADMGIVTTIDINGGTIDGAVIGGASAAAVTGTAVTGTSLVGGTVAGTTGTFSSVVDVTDTTDSSDATGDTGALRTEGGASIAKKLYVGTDVSVGNDLTVAGDLTVSGDTITVNTATLAVEDPLIALATGNDSADALDIGIYGLYDTSGSQDEYSGLFRDATDEKWKLFQDLQVAPTTTVNTGGAGYAVGTLVATLEGNVTGNLTGNASGTAATVTGASQGNITTLAALTSLGAAGATTDIVAGDVTMYNAVNDGNPTISIGSSSAERLLITTSYVSGGQLLEYVKFSTVEASSTANRGKYIFDVDGTDIVTIDDGGIDIASGKTFAINGSDIAITDTTYTAGDGLDVSGGGEFSTDLKANGGLEISSTELSVAQGISQYDVAQFAASVADDDFLRIDGTAVEGLSASEVAAAIEGSIDAVGTIATGTWQGTPITSSYINASQTGITSVGALDAGSITSNFGTIDTGSSTITTTGSLQIQTIDYTDGDLAMTIADGGGVTFAQDVTTATDKNVVLGDGANVSISTPLLANADHTTTGITAEMLAGGAISAFDLVCVHTVTQEVVEADASAYATARVIGIAPAAISDTATGTVLLQGFIRDDTWNWTTGSTLYLSETAGAMTHTAPTTDGAFVQVVGVALEPDVVYFNPSMDVIEHA